jgi:Flp pilus assembly protein TadB
MMGGLAVYLKHDGLGEILLYAVLGGGGGELCHRGQSERKRRELARRLEFHLPTAMERVVMAVGAGFDIVPALSEAARKSEDPVSDLLRAIVALSEGGLRVEHAVHMTADSVSSLPVKHAFIHLALAYRQGGEIVRPLKELSDATQTQWQEGVEEEIAKLPVRAVIPLLMTFAGLIICFLTVPVVQVGASLERFEHAAN